ncbi:ABC transporter ATP-binding protein [Chloroflexus aggregans]|uniref:ABC transporter related n=1 Tax=Chloroflexus aggregans (strain MD-66 / DSM 9485) TaxID=326427 RepID=B8G3C3_CHLAD|nr:ABC transporter ATP-binding protein [Chloroflexus aggregans]ACL25296.1 ABC transporter related [Chloroflexus aggregans DSM 9485]
MTHRDSAALPAPQMEIDRIGLSFGGVRALLSVTFNIYPGTIQAIIGPNGAGKTSLLNCISGLYRPQQGQIRFEGRNIIGLPPHQIARLGIARSFQNIELFRHMTVVDNLMLGRHIHMRSGIFSGGFYWGRAQREEVEHREFVEQVIDLLEIQAIRKKMVGSLSYGLQKRVEVGRALAMNPRLLLLDEPMAGMNSEEKEDMARFILDINEEYGTTIVLIEHDMGVVMDISDRVAVLEFGQLIAYGTPDEVRSDPKVIDAYLGREHAIPLA